jgi:hypothetical protein
MADFRAGRARGGTMTNETRASTSLRDQPGRVAPEAGARSISVRHSEADDRPMVSGKAMGSARTLKSKISRERIGARVQVAFMSPRA